VRRNGDASRKDQEQTVAGGTFVEDEIFGPEAERADVERQVMHDRAFDPVEEPALADFLEKCGIIEHADRSPSSIAEKPPIAIARGSWGIIGNRGKRINMTGRPETLRHGGFPFSFQHLQAVC
jgi:hypothetical protein